MIQLPIRRCPSCGYLGPVGRFVDDESNVTCPRCGNELGGIYDPRLA
ncbi:hypothetical protein [Haladaptatus sp. T7]|nr:hypothetical protein [Haladaptatus sp. T7]